MITFLKRSIALVSCLWFSVPALAEPNLLDHPSSYLKQHANDPVNWQLWGAQVLQQAAAQNKLVYVSIGYFSCHWCHVMQQESYADAEVGRYLNKYFIPVKVDRELRPDLDRRLIRFVEAVNGQAGWPLNVFMTADGYPVTGFTYLPRDDFYQLLQKLQQQWRQRDDEIKSIARAYFEQTESSEARSTLLELPDQHIDKLIDAFVSQSMLIADEMQGGFGPVSKFPSYPQMKALLDVIERVPQTDQDVSRFVTLTLDAMAKHHLMDQLNGGFFRYVTDPDWQTPHFEKMLYDNAQLAMLYLQADKLWPGKGYEEIGLRTVDFMLEFLRDESGGFNSSLSAVDESYNEGSAYYWAKKDLQSVLTKDEFFLFEQHLSPTDDSVLLPPLSGFHAVALPAEIRREIIKKLRRAKRPVMPADDKKLATWNALALRALLMAEQHRDDPALIAYTDQLYRFITRQMVSGNDVARMAGEVSFAETTLADYAHVARGIISYANRRNDGDAHRIAAALVDRAFDRYHQDGQWVQDPDSLIPGQTGEWVIQDSVLQSPQSLLLETIYLMPAVKSPLREKADKLLSYLTRDMLDLPFHYASSILLRHRYQTGVAQDSTKTLSGKRGLTN